MDPLNRNKFILNHHVIQGYVPINPELSRDAQFAQWRDSLPPQFCARHKRTRMIPVCNDSSSEPKMGDVSDIWYARHLAGDVPDRETRDKSYPFEVKFRCPACRCAYALCPPEFHENDFESFDTSTPERATVLALAREFAAQVKNRGCGFALFLGPAGPGKTRLACNTVRTLDNNDALYIRQGQLTNALRATYSRKDVFLHRRQQNDDDAHDDETPTPLDIVQGVHFLLLDEIGCVPLANDERLLLDELLKHRYDERKPTILISNLPLDQFKEFVGGALADRIRHAAGNGKFILQFQGESYRRITGDNYLEGRG